MSAEHKKYHFSATCNTSDAAALHCLRALCQFAEKANYPQIGWGGTKESTWRNSDGQFTVRFTRPEYRAAFLKEAGRLLGAHWELVSTNDNDPATPQR